MRFASIHNWETKCSMYAPPMNENEIQNMDHIHKCSKAVTTAYVIQYAKHGTKTKGKP